MDGVITGFSEVERGSEIVEISLGKIEGNFDGKSVEEMEGLIEGGLMHDDNLVGNSERSTE